MEFNFNKDIILKVSKMTGIEENTVETVVEALLPLIKLEVMDKPTTKAKLNEDDQIFIKRYADKTRGAAKERWDGAEIESLVGQITTVEELRLRGLTDGDIKHELTVRKNWELAS